ncbi:MAG: 50S ribosomal protein L18 [Mycoplasmataceae bacterium]|jgi:large subunit ribosomal protein L18|nr:50S ribosomal protein L18 [Mycoplasmataceae bacterium]
MKHININRKDKRSLRHKRITNRLKQFENDKPRLVISKSNNHLIAQIIDDQVGKTLVSSSSKQLKKHATVAVAKEIGMDIAKKAIAKKISTVVFDRGGSPYHGQIKALAESARENGLKF